MINGRCFLLERVLGSCFAEVGTLPLPASPYFSKSLNLGGHAPSNPSPLWVILRGSQCDLLLSPSQISFPNSKKPTRPSGLQCSQFPPRGVSLNQPSSNLWPPGPCFSELYHTVLCFTAHKRAHKDLSTHREAFSPSC